MSSVDFRGQHFRRPNGLTGAGAGASGAWWRVWDKRRSARQCRRSHLRPPNKRRGVGRMGGKMDHLRADKSAELIPSRHKHRCTSWRPIRNRPLPAARLDGDFSSWLGLQPVYRGQTFREITAPNNPYGERRVLDRDGSILSPAGASRVRRCHQFPAHFRSGTVAARETRCTIMERIGHDASFRTQNSSLSI